MTAKTLTRINIFLFMIWVEVVIFSVALFSSALIVKPFSFHIVSNYGYTAYDSLRISLVFALTTIIQNLYSYLIKKTTNINKNVLLSVINSSAISIFFINSIIKKTVISKYSLSYLGIFFCFILPFMPDIMEYLKNRDKNFQ